MPTRSDVSLARATLARFVAAMFTRPKVGRFAAGVAGVREELTACAERLGVDASVIGRALDAADADATSAESYDRVLGHTVRSDCPPYELEYRTAEVFQQAQTLADISGFYRAFGFVADGPTLDRPDHVVAQWEFLSVLALKESLADASDDLDCCRHAARAFLAEHASVWMFAFFERIRRADDSSFLAAIADLGDRLLRDWCRELDVAVGSGWLELRPVEDEDCTISCGAPGAVELGPVLTSAMEGR